MIRTISYKNKPTIIGASAVAGPKESNGAIGKYIDYRLKNDMFDENTFEKAETKMLYFAIKNAIKCAKLKENEINAVLSGDLLNQIIASTFSARSFQFGYLGLYNACATFCESVIIGGLLTDGNHFSNVVCGTSSHFSSAERQYRYPLELGSTRPPLSQWTVTGAGALVLSNKGNGVKLVQATVGRVVDFGVSDVNNMGAAMAPSAVNTLLTFFADTGKKPSDFDLILTGDLGTFGSRIFKDLLWEKGFDVEKQHVDCGELIFNICEDEYQGGSGAGCSSVVFCSYFYKKMLEKKYKKVILIATGALLSSVSSQQGESIPGVSHLISLEI